MKSPMEIVGEQSRKAIENFMKAFRDDYEIETVVADLEAGGKIPQIKGSLQVKMKKKP